MINAVNNHVNFCEGNTQVKVDANGLSVLLFGNIIYQERGNNKFFTLAGWNTVTTRSRLNALGVNIAQCNFEPICGKYGVIDKYKWYKL